MFLVIASIFTTSFYWLWVWVTIY